MSLLRLVCSMPSQHGGFLRTSNTSKYTTCLPKREQPKLKYRLGELTALVTAVTANATQLYRSILTAATKKAQKHPTQPRTNFSQTKSFFLPAPPPPHPPLGYPSHVTESPDPPRGGGARNAAGGCVRDGVGNGAGAEGGGREEGRRRHQSHICFNRAQGFLGDLRDLDQGGGKVCARFVRFHEILKTCMYTFFFVRATSALWTLRVDFVSSLFSV